MKPDKHKQKQSAQYKKKHATDPGKKSSKSHDSGGKKQGKAARQTSDPGFQPVGNVTLGQFVLKQAKSQTTPHDTDSGEDEVQSKKSFRCREIQSNWEKYDGLEQYEQQSESSRGADFKYLLQAASSAVAQFRFDDEKEWSSADGADSVAGADTLLAVDSAELALGLRCIPLPERLQIEESAFLESELNCFQELAEQCRSKYIPSVGLRDRPEEKDIALECPAPSTDNPSRDVEIWGLANEEASQRPWPDTAADDEALLESILGGGCDDNDQNEANAKGGVKETLNDDVTQRVGPSSPIVGDKCGSAGDESEALDILLCLETREEVCAMQRPCVADVVPERETPFMRTNSPGKRESNDRPGVTGVEPILVEDDLDFLLSLPSKEATQESHTRKDDQPLESSLDDWLDSVLDD